MEIYGRNVADRMDEKGKTWKGGGLFQQDHMGGGAGVQEDALRRHEARATQDQDSLGGHGRCTQGPAPGRKGRENGKRVTWEVRKKTLP